jgi:hypothetical protein
MNHLKTMLAASLLGLLFAVPVLAQNQSFEYATGIKAAVPFVESGVITLDGVADEAAWADAQVIDPTVNWDGAWSGHPDPDVFATGRILYGEGMLYVYVEVEDYDVFLDPENPGGGDQILLGVDLVHTPGVTDVQTDEGFAGFIGSRNFLVILSPLKRWRGAALWVMSDYVGIANEHGNRPLFIW